MPVPAIHHTSFNRDPRHFTNRFLGCRSSKKPITPVHSISTHRAQGAFTLFDQLPEIFRLPQGLVFARAAQIASEKEILEGIFVQHPVDPHMRALNGKINAVISGTATEQAHISALDHSITTFQPVVLKILRLNVQRLKQGELNLIGELGKLRSADLIKNDLEHVPQPTLIALAGKWKSAVFDKSSSSCILSTRF
jgi:hypothetical protein